MSLGGDTGAAVLEQAVAYACGKGILVIASAGNDAVSDHLYPAAYPRG